jgi:prevent-host-death family protein
MYTMAMNVAITDLRAHLSDWLEKARTGEEIVVTDRGIPIARLIGLGNSSTLERLTLEGVISRPVLSTKIKAAGRKRPIPTSSVADLVSEQRR